MGFMAHHAVVVHISGYVYSDNYPSGRAPAPDIAAFRETLPGRFQRLVVGPIVTAINGDLVAAFLPDGSKEGWPDSDEGDDYRRQFIELFSWCYDDGSSPFEVVHLRFGGDEPQDGWMVQPNVGHTLGVVS
ncbi:hypothetical protein [Nocardioides speluncae]|uniref:hypothetical protein n=1 Tax=Nocardioides speluncae TaxID=2670337 RepID=UPI000D697346|nr:hypothetical protein [Nocardioides speluncae]